MAEGLLMRDDREAETSPWEYNGKPEPLLQRTVDDLMLISFLSQVFCRHEVLEMVIAFDLFDIILNCVSRGNEKDAGVQPDVRSRRGGSC